MRHAALEGQKPRQVHVPLGHRGSNRRRLLTSNLDPQRGSQPEDNNEQEAPRKL